MFMFICIESYKCGKSQNALESYEEARHAGENVYVFIVSHAKS
jgi:hypothetical protein